MSVSDGTDPPRRSTSRIAGIIGILVALAILVAQRTSPGQPTPNDLRRGASSADDQLDGLRFTDVTRIAGLDHRQSSTSLVGDLSTTSGAAVADFDADGDMDVYLTRTGLPNSLYRNNDDGTFTDIALAAGVAGGDVANGSSAAAFADVDADGCIDLFVTGAQAGRDALFLNDCHGRFNEAAAERGLAAVPNATHLGAQKHNASFADFDRDGDLDLLVLQWSPDWLQSDQNLTEFQRRTGSALAENSSTVGCVPESEMVAGVSQSTLYRNDGHGYFSDVTAAMGLDLHSSESFTGQFSDVDGDGWQDLLIAGDFCSSRLFLSQHGEGFVDVTRSAGVGTEVAGMGSVVRDMNGDGRPDWFVTATFDSTAALLDTDEARTHRPGNRLYLNLGGARFADATDDFGVRDGSWGWGVAIEDFANNGSLAIAQTNGHSTAAGTGTFDRDSTRLWVRGRGSSAYRDVAAIAGIDDSAVGHALVPFDFDNDGDLDILIANFGTAPRLFRNDRPIDRHWLTIRLDDPSHPGNRSGIGARIRILDRADSQPVTGWIATDGSYESQKPAEFHVGFGDSGRPVSKVEVWWPDSDEPTVLEAVTKDQQLTIVRR